MSTAGDRELTLHPDVRVSSEFHQGAGEVRFIKRFPSGPVLTVASHVAELVSSLNGRTLPEISEDLRRVRGVGLNRHQQEQVHSLLDNHALLSVTEAVRPQVGDEDAPRARSWRAATYPLVTDATGVLAGASRMSARARLSLIWVVAVVGALTLVAAGLSAPTLVLSAWQAWESPLSVAVAVIIIWLTFAVHELFHGVVAIHVGATAREFGIQWRFPIFAPYTAVQDLVFVTSRWQRAAVALIGGAANLACLLPALAVWMAAGQDSYVGQTAALVVLAGAVLSVVDYLPLPPLDGYSALTHLTGSPHLARESFGLVGALLTRRRSRVAPYRGMSRRRGALLTLYAAVACLCVAATALLVASLASRALSGWLATFSFWTVLVLVLLALGSAVVAASHNLAPHRR